MAETAFVTGHAIPEYGATVERTLPDAYPGFGWVLFMPITMAINVILLSVLGLGVW